MISIGDPVQSVAKTRMMTWLLLTVSLTLAWPAPQVSAQPQEGAPLRVPPGSTLRATVDGKTVQAQVEDVPPLRLHELRDQSGTLVQAFSDRGPYRATVRMVQDYREFPSLYALLFYVNPIPGQGTVVSSDPSIVRVVNKDYTTEDARGDSLISRRLVPGRSGKARITVTYKSQRYPSVTTFVAFEVIVSAVEIDIVDVPDFAEEDVGGFVRVGDLIELRLTYPTGVTPGWFGDSEPQVPLRYHLIALEGKPIIRLWHDRGKTQPILLPATFEGATGPRRIFAEALAASDTVRDIELRFSAASGLRVLGLDSVRLTAIDLKIDPAAVVLGQNDDDDNEDNVKDFEQEAGRVAGEDDLWPVDMIVRPFVRSLGRVQLGLTPGLSLWRSFDRSPETALFNGLVQPGGIVHLMDPKDWNQRYYIEGLATLNVPQTITLSVFPEVVVNGRAVQVGMPVSATAELTVVKAAIDIDGVPDEGNNEFVVGGEVSLAASNDSPPKRDQMTLLRLKLAPDGYQPDSVRLTVTRGAANIRLWATTGPGNADDATLKELALTEALDEGKAIDFRFGEIPKELYIQGLKSSDPQGIELRLTNLDSRAVTGRAHTDRVSLTVVGKLPTGEELVLEPALIVALTSLEEHEKLVPLNVLLKNATGDVVADVATDPATSYLWPPQGLSQRLTDVPVAQLEMKSHGVLTVKSRGVQVLQAKRGSLISNVALVLAGLKLKSIDLEPESLITTPLSTVWKDVPLILAHENNSYFKSQGIIVLKDVTFEFIDGVGTLKLSDLTGALSILGKLPPVKFVKWGLKVLGQQMVEFKSGDPSVVTADSWIPRGRVASITSGITSIIGTLTLDQLGSTDDAVLAIVLPEIERVEIRAPEDPPGQHEATVDLRLIEGLRRKRVSAYAETKSIARSVVPLSEKLEKWEEGLDRVLPGGTEAFARGRFDINVPWPTDWGVVNVRMRGEVRESENKKGASAAVFTNVVFGFPAIDPIDTWKSTNDVVATVQDGAHEGLFFVPLTANQPGYARAMAEVKLPGMGGGYKLRKVQVKAARCEVGTPVLHFGKGLNARFGEEIAAQDARFINTDEEAAATGVVTAPFRMAFENLRIPGKPVLTRVGPFPASDSRMASVSPWTAGWLYFIEVPVNDPTLCDLSIQTSKAVGEDNSLRRLPTNYRNGQSQLGYTIGRYQEDKQVDGMHYALVFAGLQGWFGITGTERRVDRYWERLSVLDTETGGFRASADYSFQMVLDSTKSGPPTVASDFVGSSADRVSSIPPLDPPPPQPVLDAANKFRNIRAADKKLGTQ